MEFEFSYEQKTLAQSISRCIRDGLPPPPVRAKEMAGGGSSSGQVWSSLSEIGAVGALFHESVGGYGESAFDILNVFEVLGRELLVDQPFLACLLAGGILAKSPSHAELFGELVQGSVIATLAHCEGDGAWEPEYVTTSARSQADRWILDGVKAAVPNADEAHMLVVSARTSGAASDSTGISTFLVPADQAGVVIRAYPEIDGARAAEVTLQSVELPQEALIGHLDGAFASLAESIAMGTLALSTQAVGAMETLTGITTEYLKVRRQFGNVIGSNQALQHRIVEMMLVAEQSRSAVINAADLASSSRLDFLKAVAAAKVTTGAAATQIAEEAIQMHGGIGMTWELDAAHYASWLSMFDLRLGDAETHLARYLELDAEAA